MANPEEHPIADPVYRMARARYEKARAIAALGWSVPVLVIIFLAWLLDRDLLLVGIGGPILFLSAWFLFWRGGPLGRSVLPGIAAGAVPFVVMHLARAHGHVCHGPLCFSVCLPATFGASALTALVIALRARWMDLPVVGWAATGFVAVVTGSLGCACIGLGGVAGLIAGLLVGSIPVALRMRTARTR